MLTRLFIVLALYAASSTPSHAYQNSTRPQTTAPSAITGLTTTELLQAITDWDGTVPLDESKRTREQVVKEAALEELKLRLRRNLLIGDDLDALLTRCYQGDESATPMTQAWKDKYLWLLETYWGATPLVRPIEDMGYKIPFDVSTRLDFIVRDGDKDWPAMMSTPLWMEIRTAWRPSMGRKVRVLVDLPAAIPMWGICTEELYVLVPPLGAGEHDLSILVEIYATDGAGVDRLLQSRKVPVKLNVVDPAIEFVPFKSEAIGTAIKKNLRPQLFQMAYDDAPAKDGKSAYSLMLNFDRDWINPELTQRDSLGVVIELLDDEDNVRLQAFYGCYGEKSRSRQESVIELTSTDVEKSWTVRVRPLPALALAMYREHLTIHPSDRAVGGAVRYWTGEVIMPVRVNKD